MITERGKDPAMGDIRFECPKCGRHLVINEGGAGLFVTCPTCGQLVHVPAESPAPAAPSPLPDKTKTDDVGSRVCTAGTICFLIGAGLVFGGDALYFFCVPLFIASFVLSIIAIVKGAVGGGIRNMLFSLILAPIIMMAPEIIKGALKIVDARAGNAKSGLNDAVAQVVIEEKSAEFSGDYATIKGKVRNNGGTPVKYVKVAIEWLDENGVVLDSDNTYAVGSDELRPGAAKSFSAMTPKDERMKTFRCWIMNE
jgi:hypothetical protein